MSAQTRRLKKRRRNADIGSVVELDLLLAHAVQLGASDVHLKIGRPPVFRLDGTLTPLPDTSPLTDADLEAVLLGVTETVPHRLETFRIEGELDIAYTSGDLPRFRVNGFRQRGAVSFAFRVIPKQIPSFESLSMPAGVQKLADEHRGLVLVTGETGSGKTTTLAAMVDFINRTRKQHIVTIEDPIEILHSDAGCIVSQREVGVDTASFHEALRRALRQDPDVILIGELRDADTAQTALHAAESGHLVLSTMHTVDASETVGRMVELFPGAKQPLVRSVLAGVLRGVISQRLLPKVDRGRIAAVEVMVNNARIADLIRENRADEIHDAIEDGSFFQMQTFMQALLDLVVTGQVEQEVAANAATNRHDFLVALDRALKTDAVEKRVAEQEASEPELPELRILRPTA
jgi:twitching motility protein PilT